MGSTTRGRNKKNVRKDVRNGKAESRECHLVEEVASSSTVMVSLGMGERGLDL